MQFNPEIEARRILRRERTYTEVCVPIPEPIFLDWRNGMYIGAIQTLYREQPELAYLTKSIERQDNELLAALRKLGDERPTLTADDDMDLSGPGYHLRRVGSRLTRPTPEQRKYIEEHPFGAIKIMLP